jgi:hypothetical protein
MQRLTPSYPYFQGPGSTVVTLMWTDLLLPTRDIESCGGGSFFDFRAAALMGLEPAIRFTAHSLVQSDSGERYDITPSPASQCYPFIEHPFGREDFDNLVNGRRLSHIDVEVES